MALAPLALAVFAACASEPAATSAPPHTVERVEPSRYAGTWYEIARIPNRFQKGCVAVTATYQLRDDGTFRVVNRCREERFDGREKTAKGKAWATDAANTKFKVQFFWPFRGDYWVLELGCDYEYAVVGHPERRFGWILSRTPHMSDALYRELLGRLEAQGYDPARFVRTPQPGGEPLQPEKGYARR